MNGSAHMNHPGRRFKRPALWLGLCGLMSLLSAQSALATDALYQNFDVLNFTVPGSPPPQIDATAFDNENQFTVNFATPTANAQSFETYNTLYYTNNGLMVANSPLSINGLFLSFSLGCGFQFDVQNASSGFHSMSANFYNPGVIRVNSLIDVGANALLLAGVGKMVVSATNIVNPGTVTLGQDGLMQFTGQNVDLKRSQLDMESTITLAINSAAVGRETNFIIPSFNFTLPNPFSPLLALSNATAYVNDAFTGPLNRFVRAVFISNPIPNVTNNVYFGFGDNIIEWVGSYLNPTNGLQTTNYLYFEDDFGEITNLQVNVGGGPVGFFWSEGGPLFLGPKAPPGLPPGTFATELITNDYAYEAVSLLATTVGTNAGALLPNGTVFNGALTNIPARIQVSASRDLDLNLAHIAGPNYLLLNAPNHFEGSKGAQIFSPFCDINIGVTNGFLSVSNLLEPSVPVWNGPVQVFSTRWKSVDALGVTNNYHVLLVNSQVLPTTEPTVQDLVLHTTNLFVSDKFNIMRKLSIDATSLTLTTNMDTAGIGAQDGEINWNNSTTFGTAQMPNLKWLTNNGAIRAANLAVFGSSAAPYGAFINTSLMVDQGATIYASNFLSGGVISNGVGAFTLQSTATTLTNVVIAAGGNVSITTGSLLVTNVALLAGKSLTLNVTNSLMDNGPVPTNGNIWVLGGTSVGNGLNLPIKPAISSLLGTTITNIGPASRNVANTWAASDFGVSTVGYSNNAAIGRLILDSLGTSPNAQFTFNGTGVSNAIYVDYLELKDYATNRDVNGNASALAFNNNLVIYYAQAVVGGVSVAEKLNHKNGDHLRWVPAYAGYYSSIGIANPDGTTNYVNAALAKSTTLDSDGDGIDNAHDATPFFTAANVNFTSTLTNAPPLQVRLQWQTIPGATNYVLYRTNLWSANWQLLTNFISFTNVPPVGGWPITTNVFDAVSPSVQKYYRVRVDPNSASYYGP